MDGRTFFEWPDTCDPDKWLILSQKTWGLPFLDLQLQWRHTTFSPKNILDDQTYQHKPTDEEPASSFLRKKPLRPKLIDPFRWVDLGRLAWCERFKIDLQNLEISHTICVLYDLHTTLQICCLFKMTLVKSVKLFRRVFLVECHPFQ